MGSPGSDGHPGIRSRTGSGQPIVHCSTVVASHETASRSSYSANGQNSPHPAGPSLTTFAGQTCVVRDSKSLTSVVLISPAPTPRAPPFRVANWSGLYYAGQI